MKYRHYLVYQLIDPRTSVPFYIGRSKSILRLQDHIAEDKTRKGRRIKEIENQGFEISRQVILYYLTEKQAIKAEAFLINLYGNYKMGGPLLNEVIPTGNANPCKKKHPTVPQGLFEKCVNARTILEESILELAKCNPDGISNADVANTLGLESCHNKKARNYLSYSLLGSLVDKKKLTKIYIEDTKPVYKIN